ncbi:ATP-binding SpoIIE family protein phosphatase [Alkalimarinus sediminis]|uniref:Fused response regulator/phosphatase n=1 Tax=Alkalimarinus sediminis TaxID=1632866 RepID=A0A9E8HPR6_9ALTE|nr:fused response regulator/phosphatase [Alkalimarinus sediminis]UZW76488.1 fused response regulator/phosphatase [Alkalimarinus sediminis]
MNVLIVDDQRTNREILAWILEDLGHDHEMAQDGKEALEKVKAQVPDLILMDVVMPVMDGYEATREIKKFLGSQYIPVIFLTALTDESTLIKCLESGGDDFLSKPVDQIVLHAKMKAHGRTRELNEQIRNKNSELVYLHNRLQQEHAMGEHVLTNAMKESVLDSPCISHYISPASLFNGDLLLAAPKPSGGLYVFLGDFTGHGLAASIGAIPVSQAFYAMTAKELSLTEIARTLNSSLYKFLPDHMFCAATLVELNQAGDMAKLWMGGLPDGVVISNKDGIKGTITSQHMPLGILDDSEFEDDLEFIKLSEGDSIVCYTDGITEGVNSQGEMFGEERLQALLAKKVANPLDELVDGFHVFKGGTEQEDDISVVQIKSMPTENLVRGGVGVELPLPWCISTKLNSKELINLSDPAAKLMKMMPNTAIFNAHGDTIRSIISEMYSNALEHGLLRLDSKLKDTEDGFIEYYKLREERVRALEGESISIEIQYDPAVDNNILVIEVSDSGCGFDIDAVVSRLGENTEELSYGRGLALIKSFSKEIKFLSGGSTIVVKYDLATR